MNAVQFACNIAHVKHQYVLKLKLYVISILLGQFYLITDRKQKNLYGPRFLVRARQKYTYI
jgi:hypothetical protein